MKSLQVKKIYLKDKGFKKASLVYNMQNRTKMKNITGFLILITLALAYQTHAQSFINAGADIYVSGGSSLIIGGNFTNLNDGSLNNDGNIFLSGNWNNNATSGELLMENGGTVIFNGNSPQIIGGTTTTWFGHLVLHQELGLEVFTSVRAQLEFNESRIILNEFDLDIDDGANPINYGSSGYIVTNGIGKVTRFTFENITIFPVGSFESYTPLILTNNGLPAQYGVRVFDGVYQEGYPGELIGEIDHTTGFSWEVNPVPENADFDLEGFWNPENEGADFNRQEAGIGHFTNGAWQPGLAAEADGAGPFSLPATGLSKGGIFAVGDVDSPLAYTIQLINQQIIITEGWSGISSYIDPANANVDAVFQAIIDELIILQSETSMYWPGENLNTIGNWDAMDGYKIKVTNQVELTISGAMIENANVELTAGWNLIPVLSTSAVDVAALFNGLDVTMVKDVAGFGIYWPDYNINTLQVLEPGKSYFALVGSLESISFGDQNLKVVAEQSLPAEIDSPWAQSATSPYSHVIAFHQDALAFFVPGDILALFDQSGNCSGLAEYSGNDFAIVAFGDDLMADNAHGFVEGDQIDYKLFRPSIGETYTVEVEYESLYEYSGKFVVNGLSVVNKLKMSPSGLSTESGASIHLYPNPTNGIFHITGIDVESSILVYNSIGEVFYNYRDFGLQKIDMSGNPKGLYIVKISNNESSVYRKFILQ